MSTTIGLILIFATWVPAWLLMPLALPWGTLGLAFILLLGNTGALLAVVFAH